MERSLLRQIWPVFSAEAREHLASIGSGVLDLERDAAQPGVLERVRRIAHSLKGSAGSLGLGDLERLAHAIESSLSGFDPAVGLSRATVQAALDAVRAIEVAVAAGDAGGDPRVGELDALLVALGAAPAAPAAPARAPAGPEALDGLEAALAALCTPLEPADRAHASEEAAVAAEALAAGLPAHGGQIARIAAAFRRLGSGGDEAARDAATAAGELIALREILEGRQAAAASTAQATPAAPRDAEAARDVPTDRSIRVLASALDSLARQLELLALAEGRHARRARELGEAEAALREATGRVEEAATALRSAGVGTGKGELDQGVARLRGVAADVARLAREGRRESEGQRLSAAVLREDLRALRMVPAAILLEPVRRTVREVAGRVGHEVQVEVEGGDVKLDRRIADLLRDPLQHLVRNAVDHGIEAPHERVAAGKPAAGKISVRVEPRGARVALVIEDDGRGLDPAAIRAAAVRRGLLSAEAAARMPDDEAVKLVFRAGVSTAAAVTEISGRGVGLDVVQEALTRVQGTVDVHWQAGRGSRFDLEVPLTLAATAALLFRTGRDLGALPAETVERVVLHGDAELGTVAGRVTLLVGGEPLPYAPLHRLLGGTVPPTRETRRVALVLRHAGARVALGVEEIVGQQELVVTPLGARVAQVTHLAGAAMLDDGRVVGVLAAPELVRRTQPATAARAATAARPRVVVADDSLTTRSAMKALLEIAGYAVLAAGDGEEALGILRESGAPLLVSDVQMPRMDGFGLCRAVKSDPALRATRVILVTSLDAPEDRAAGLEAGADGYVVKREVERGKLLELVRQLLPGPAMIRCLVCDDSRTFRAVLRAVLARAPGVEVVGEAADGHEAVDLVERLRPDVVTMDVRMPGKDGLAAIAEIMERAPTPVIVVSAEVGPERQGVSFEALARGAIEVLAKPRGEGAAFERDAEAIRQAVRAVAGLRLVTRHRRARGPGPAPSFPTPPPLRGPQVAPPAPGAWPPPAQGPAAIVGVAASTGGPPVLAALLRGLPSTFAAPILIVQHIAAGFEGGLAHWLTAEGGRGVRVAQDGESIRPGTVWIAPDGKHLVPRSGLLRLVDSPPVRGFRPSGTVLLQALAREYGGLAAGLVLSGMGDDGAEGLRAIRARGGPTAAQGAASSVVFGMPRVALEGGGAAESVEADDLVAWVTRVAR